MESDRRGRERALEAVLAQQAGPVAGDGWRRDIVGLGGVGKDRELLTKIENSHFKRQRSCVFHQAELPP